MDYNGAVMNPVVFFPSVIGSKRKASDRKRGRVREYRNFAVFEARNYGLVVLFRYSVGERPVRCLKYLLI